MSTQDVEEIRNAIREKYAAVSVSASGKFLYSTGQEGARALGYDLDILERGGPELLQSFCGVGNPFSLDRISPGDRVLDIGCGAGFDLFVASLLVGETGLVCGIDLTEEMAELAAKNLAGAGLTNFEVRKVDSELIPYEDDFFDVVISNGVINLSPDKAALFKEAHRVLKPGGKIQFADIALVDTLPACLKGSLEAWSQWIGGAVPVGDQISVMKEAGFADVECFGMTGFHTSQYTAGALFRGKKPERR